VLITADEAKLMAGTSAVAVARKGQTLDFIRYGERGLVLVQGLFDGQAKKGWLTTPKDGVVRELAKATVVVQPNQTPLMVHSQEIAKLNKGQSAAFQHLDDKDNYALVELVLDGKKVQGWVAKTALFGPEPPLAGKAAKAK
jgi:hypothetical protein